MGGICDPMKYRYLIITVLLCLSFCCLSDCILLAQEEAVPDPMDGIQEKITEKEAVIAELKDKVDELRLKKEAHENEKLLKKEAERIKRHRNQIKKIFETSFGCLGVDDMIESYRFQGKTVFMRVRCSNLLGASLLTRCIKSEKSAISNFKIVNQQQRSGGVMLIEMTFNANLD